MRVTVLWLLGAVVFYGSVHGQTVIAQPRSITHDAIAKSEVTQLSDYAALGVEPPALVASASRRSHATALGIEALGGIAGSAIGFGALIGKADCGENLSCTFGNAATALLLGTLGAAGGAYAAGRLGGTEPSGWGAAVGAIAGAAAVVGVDHVLSGTNTSDTSRYITFAVTQGLITAIGSRIGTLLR